jgi:hypothetical protein
MAGHRTLAGDFFEKIHVLGIARMLLDNDIEFIRHDRRRRFTGDLLKVFGKLRSR